MQKAKADFASGVGTFSSERQSSNASLVIGLFGPLATISEFLKVRLHSHDFLSWHSARKRTAGGFQEERAEEKLDTSYALLENLINKSFSRVGTICVASSR